MIMNWRSRQSRSGSVFICMISSVNERHAFQVSSLSRISSNRPHNTLDFQNEIGQSGISWSKCKESRWANSFWSNESTQGNKESRRYISIHSVLNTIIARITWNIVDWCFSRSRFNLSFIFNFSLTQMSFDPLPLFLLRLYVHVRVVHLQRSDQSFGIIVFHYISLLFSSLTWFDNHHTTQQGVALHLTTNKIQSTGSSDSESLKDSLTILLGTSMIGKKEGFDTQYPTPW